MGVPESLVEGTRENSTVTLTKDFLPSEYGLNGTSIHTISSPPFWYTDVSWTCCAKWRLTGSTRQGPVDYGRNAWRIQQLRNPRNGDRLTALVYGAYCKSNMWTK